MLLIDDCQNIQITEQMNELHIMPNIASPSSTHLTEWIRM